MPGARPLDCVRAWIKSDNSVSERREISSLQPFSAANFKNAAKALSDFLPNNSRGFLKAKMLAGRIEFPGISKQIQTVHGRRIAARRTVDVPPQPIFSQRFHCSHFLKPLPLTARLPTPVWELDPALCRAWESSPDALAPPGKRHT